MFKILKKDLRVINTLFKKVNVSNYKVSGIENVFSASCSSENGITIFFPFTPVEGENGEYSIPILKTVNGDGKDVVEIEEINGFVSFGTETYEVMPADVEVSNDPFITNSVDCTGEELISFFKSIKNPLNEVALISALPNGLFSLQISKYICKANFFLNKGRDFKRCLINIPNDVVKLLNSKEHYSFYQTKSHLVILSSTGVRIYIPVKFEKYPTVNNVLSHLALIDPVSFTKEDLIARLDDKTLFNELDGAKVNSSLLKTILDYFSSGEIKISKNENTLVFGQGQQELMVATIKDP